MPWLEMSRDADHGGPGWDFGVCLWSPTRRQGGGRWGYWELMQRVKEGDVVLHLRGEKTPEFSGHSIADSDCYITSERPPSPGVWEHATDFYRVPLRDYCPFEKRLSLSNVFSTRADLLTQYHAQHSPASAANGRYLFYVTQAGRLQCQNGAYLSEVDEELSSILFGLEFGGQAAPEVVSTGTGMATLLTRIGQGSFSEAVRRNYGRKCCFPKCRVEEDSFLIGAHIVRWSDSKEDRGNIANGLCLCLMHDKAFEAGLFVVDSSYHVVPTKAADKSQWAIANVIPFAGQQISIGPIVPGEIFLKNHWERVGHSADGGLT
jgi:putative restriction endonuclease